MHIHLVLVFLGIEIDSVKQVYQLPPQKLICLTNTIQQWLGKDSATKHHLQVPLSHLNHSAAAILNRQTFTHQLINAMKIPQKSSQSVNLNTENQSDNEWCMIHLSWQLEQFINYYKSAT